MIKDADLEYLRNISTRPGPGAGHSIDPSKPGPDDALAQSDAKPFGWIYKAPGSGWKFTQDAEIAKIGRTEYGWPIHEVYTAPPRHDEFLRARAANRSGPADYIPTGGAGNGA